MALDAKARCEGEAYRVKCYSQEINEIENMIDRLLLVYSFRLQKGKLCNDESGGASEWQLKVIDKFIPYKIQIYN